MSTLTIRTPADIERLYDRGARWRVITVAVPGLDDREAGAFARRLARGYAACGCNGARNGALIGLVVAGVWMGYSFLWASPSLIAIAFGGAALLCAAALVGRAISIWSARRALRQAIAEFRKRAFADLSIS